jgi:hypothetical protein
MDEKNFLIGIGCALLSVLGFGLCLLPIRGLKGEASIGDRVRRSLITGLGFLICFSSGAVAVDYLWWQNSENTWDFEALQSLLCLAFPFAVIVSAGAYMKYTNMALFRKK